MIVRAMVAAVGVIVGGFGGVQRIVGVIFSMRVLVGMSVFMRMGVAMRMGVREIAMPMLMCMNMSVGMLMDVVVGATVIAVTHWRPPEADKAI